MAKELNIATILKDKSENTKLWSPIVGDCTYSGISSKNGAIIATFTDKYGEERDWDFKEDGRTLSASDDADVCLFPSKTMRSWEKFAWKKGDVLTNNCGFICIFKEWATDDYTKFNGCYSNSRDGYEDVPNAETFKFNKVDHNTAYGYIREMEKKLGGIFNTSTLEIEKPQFKDGDIVAIDIIGNTDIAILEDICTEDIVFHTVLCNGKDLFLDEPCKVNNVELRLATDSEKQQLFAALEKEGKRWNSETKTLEGLPKKCEFKPMDLCLMRFRGTNKDVWKLCQFGFFDDKDKNDLGYCAIGGNWFNECIPYNDQTAHLLGTTDDWKGGEV